jgi:acyl dehydratase
MRAFEDFEAGATLAYGGIEVSRDDVVAFARDYDPQPFHLDEGAARDTFAGELIGSGWHMCALLMRLIADGFLLESTSQGSPGIEAARWIRPLRPGDRVSARHAVLETRALKSRPDLGLVRFRFELLNGAGETLMEQTNAILFGRRGAPAPEPLVPHAPAWGPAPAAPEPGPDAFPFFEDVAIGETAELGARRFDADAVVGFARRFDPQRFHVDEAAARESLFGGLCASGWHTAAAWMRHMVDHRAAAARAARAAGRTPARLGSSPGFSDLSWRKPVYAGDVIAFRSTLVDKRPSASRPGWGLVFHDNTGHNQHGDLVYSFRGCVFWERRG